jgi:hypothetical protein
MRIYASPRRGHCASCEQLITARPVYHMDETYCCVGCVQGGPCLCTYEADLADDGVIGLGLPFMAEPAAPVVAQPAEPATSRPTRERGAYEPIAG